MSVIVCKYIGPTNHKGSRISVSNSYERMVLPMDGRYDFEKNCEKAVENFLLKHDYEGTWIGSHGPVGMVFISLTSVHKVTVGAS